MQITNNNCDSFLLLLTKYINFIQKEIFFFFFPNMERSEKVNKRKREGGEVEFNHLGWCSLNMSKISLNVGLSMGS